jgi:hypothetical protein
MTLTQTLVYGLLWFWLVSALTVLTVVVIIFLTGSMQAMLTDEMIGKLREMGGRCFCCGAPRGVATYSLATGRLFKPGDAWPVIFCRVCAHWRADWHKVRRLKGHEQKGLDHSEICGGPVD